MENMELMTQMKFFEKKYQSALQSDKLDEFNTANLLLNKMVPQLEELSGSVDDLKLSSIFESLSEFIYNYCLILAKNQEPTIDIQPRLKWLAEKALVLNNESFWGSYYLSIFHAFEIIPLGCESGANLLEKGISAISKSVFSKKLDQVLETYKKDLEKTPVSAKTFLKKTNAMLNLADICHGIFISNQVKRNIHGVIGQFDINSLDFSEYDNEDVVEKKEEAMELIILANANL